MSAASCHAQGDARHDGQYQGLIPGRTNKQDVINHYQGILYEEHSIIWTCSSCLQDWPDPFLQALVEPIVVKCECGGPRFIAISNKVLFEEGIASLIFKQVGDLK